MTEHLSQPWILSLLCIFWTGSFEHETIRRKLYNSLPGRTVFVLVKREKEVQCHRGAWFERHLQTVTWGSVSLTWWTYWVNSCVAFSFLLSANQRILANLSWPLVLYTWYMQAFSDSKRSNEHLYLMLKVYLRLLFECMFLLWQKHNNYRTKPMLLLLQSLSISEEKWSSLSLVFNRFCFPISPRFKKAIALWQSNLQTDFFGICASGIAVCW